MGKRSDFKRVERDYYRTWDPRAVAPLLPHLPETFTAWEPCAGDGSLVKLIGRGDWVMSDLDPQADNIAPVDAMQTRSLVEFIITNPPWTRTILHPMIDHFRQIAPTWLLFDAAWAFTKQSAPFMPFCSKIVAVGRIRWIEGSKMDGKDDCAWYCFEAKRCETVFHGRAHERA
jgi:hypothetical protein